MKLLGLSRSGPGVSVLGIARSRPYPEAPGVTLRRGAPAAAQAGDLPARPWP